MFILCEGAIDPDFALAERPRGFGRSDCVDFGFLNGFLRDLVVRAGADEDLGVFPGKIHTSINTCNVNLEFEDTCHVQISYHCRP